MRGEGAAVCPGKAELHREVVRRIGRDPFDDAAPRAVEVTVEKPAGGWRAVIRFRGASSEEAGLRMLESTDPDCGSVFSAVALAIALGIDPDSRLDSGMSGGGAPTELTAATSTAAPEAPPPVAASPTRGPSQVSPSDGGAHEPALADPPPRAALSSAGLVAVGLLPRAALGVGLHTAVSLGDGFWFVAGARYFPAVATTQPALGDFDVGLTAGGVRFAYEIAHSRSTSVAVHAGADAGALHVAVFSPAPTPREPEGPGDVFWAAAAGGMEARVRVGGPVAVVAGAEALVPLVRPALSSVGEKPAFEPPAVGAVASVALSMSLF